LKTTAAKLDAEGEPQLSYEDVDTSLITPRPRLYGLVGADAIEQVWKERQAAKTPATAGSNGNGQSAGSAAKVTA
jgi:succinate dehydrogenase / fumarate reductase flavoprotein subunit